jgi:translocation protein SEC63
VQARSLREYLHVPDEEKKGLSTLSEEEKADVLLVCNEIIPKLKVEWKLFVEEDEEDDALEGPPEDKRDENVSIFNSQPLDKNALVKYKELSQARSAISGERIYENDLISLRLTITRENVLEGNTAPPVHAPHFPRPVKETWWAVLTDKPKVDPKKGAEPQANLYSIEKITDQSRVVKHVMRFAAPPKAGKYSVVVQLLSSCYLGLDMSFDIDFEVFPASELPEYMPHPEDV